MFHKHGLKKKRLLLRIFRQNSITMLESRAPVTFLVLLTLLDQCINIYAPLPNCTSLNCSINGYIQRNTWENRIPIICTGFWLTWTKILTRETLSTSRSAGNVWREFAERERVSQTAAGQAYDNMREYTGGCEKPQRGFETDVLFFSAITATLQHNRVLLQSPTA